MRTSITQLRRLPIQEDRMRELKDGGTRQPTERRTREISPSHYYTSPEIFFSSRKT